MQLSIDCNTDTLKQSKGRESVPLYFAQSSIKIPGIVHRAEMYPALAFSSFNFLKTDLR